MKAIGRLEVFAWAAADCTPKTTTVRAIAILHTFRMLFVGVIS
jgi:hypothetical protein